MKYLFAFLFLFLSLNQANAQGTDYQTLASQTYYQANNAWNSVMARADGINETIQGAFAWYDDNWSEMSSSERTDFTSALIAAKVCLDDAVISLTQAQDYISAGDSAATAQNYQTAFEKYSAALACVNTANGQLDTAQSFLVEAMYIALPYVGVNGG